MTVMAEVKENIVFQGDGEADKAVAVVANADLALVKAYDDALQSLQDQSTSNDVKECKTSEQKAHTEKFEEGETQKAMGSEVQCKAAAEPKAKSERHQWEVGAQCNALWSKDGRVYPGKVVWMDGRRCRVKFDGYNSEEEMALSALKCPEPTEQPQKDRWVWRVGSRCRAIYSEDGLAYPAVLLWIKGDRCRVKFDNYGNEEELDLTTLLSQDELNGPCRAASVRATSGERSTHNSSSTWRRRREESYGERTGGERDRERRTPQQEEEPSPHLTSGKEWSRNYNKAEKDHGDGRRGNIQKDAPERSSSNPFSIFPPMPPPPSNGQGDFVPFLPPLPPLMYMWPPRAGGEEARASLDVDMAALSSMLLSWYLCGYHTGCFMGIQQSKFTSKGPPSSIE